MAPPRTGTRRPPPRRRPRPASRRPSAATYLWRRLIAGWGAVVLLVTLGMFVQRWLADGPSGPDACAFTNANGARFDLSTEQAKHAATISALATKRDLPERAATIAIATSLQESKLLNLSYGDRDSLGLFQQRPSQGWGTKDQVMDPVYATNTFYDYLVKVPGWEGLPLTQAAQKVQFSGFPEAYAKHETEAETYAGALTGARVPALGCRLPSTDTSRTPKEVAADLLREVGVEATVTPTGLALRTMRDREARTAAAWAVAQADRHGVTEVSLGPRVWRRSAKDAALTWTSEGTAAPTEVRIVLAGRG